MSFVTACSGLGTSQSATAQITAAELPDVIAVSSVPLAPAGPGTGDCAGLDPEGPFLDPLPHRTLRGGGGCDQSRPQPDITAWWAALLLLAHGMRKKHGGGRRRYGAPRVPFRVGMGMLMITGSGPAAGCAVRHEIDTPSDEPRPAVVDIDELKGPACDDANLMVLIEPEDGPAFCIDRFEASVEGAVLGNPHQASGDDTGLETDGTTQARATVTLQGMPAAGLTWYQAKAACDNANKRLCTASEWELACGGPGDVPRFFPYGDVHDETACNGFFNETADEVLPTESLPRCASPFGVYDLSGNLAEWVATAVERRRGSGIANDRTLRGGSYASNEVALACAGLSVHAPPATSSPRYGFRCCADGK